MKATAPPQSAARRLVERLPNARFVVWPDEVGHLYGYHHEGEILDELLARHTGSGT